MGLGRDVFFLWGEEEYLIDRKIAGIIGELHQDDGDRPEVARVDPDDLSAAELGNILEFSPLFDLRRVVVMKNPAWLGKSNRKSRKSAGAQQVLEDYCQRDHPGQTLIITATENNAANPIVKLLHKNGRVINLKPLPPAERLAWCRAELDRRGLQMAPAALLRMAESGQDMYYLQNLLDKLSLLIDDGPISLQMVENNLDLRQEVRVFKLTDALMDRNLGEALDALNQLQEQGEHHLLLLHMISRQYFNLARIKAYQGAGYSSGQIAAEIGQKDFAVKKLMGKSSRFNPVELRHIFEILMAADTSFKSESKDPQLIMETLLVEMCCQ